MAENRPEITETPAALQQNGRRHIHNSNLGLLIGWIEAKLITFPFKPNAPWTTLQRRNKKIRIGNFSLDGSSHQTGDAAFTPATPHDLHHSRANNDSHNSHNTQLV